MDAAPVEFGLIAGCVCAVCGVVGGEVVAAGEVFAGAHVDEVVGWGTKDAEEGCFGGDSDGSGG